MRPKIRASGIKGSRGRIVFMTHTASEIILCDACCNPIIRPKIRAAGIKGSRCVRLFCAMHVAID